MSITAVNQINAASAPSATVPKGEDFNMFLKLLTTQMQNQDPLDPMKTNEYTQQLAQYTQVEQTVQQSTTLKEILARLSTQDLAQASSMIGRDAVFMTDRAGLDAAPATWTYAPAANIAALEATITDANGVVVDARSIDPGVAKGQFSWDGQLPAGKTARPGVYQLSLAATGFDGRPVPVTIESIGTVAAVNQANGAVGLVVNGASLPLSALRSIAAPAT